MTSASASSLGRMARITGDFVVERLTPRRRTPPGGVPGRASAITAEWLTAALCSDVPGAVVRDVTVIPLSDGSTSRSMLKVRYNLEGSRAGLPESVFVKSTTSLPSRFNVGMTGAAEGEWRFYSRIRPSIDVLAPVGYYGKSDRTSGRSILLLEDISLSRGATFGDARSREVDLDMARSMIKNLARIHGSLNRSDRLDGDLKWLRTSEQMQRALNSQIQFEARTDVGVTRSAHVLPASLVDDRKRIFPALMNSLALDDPAGFGLIHTDVHSGNWFVTPDRKMGLYDWQALGKGEGFRDVAYAVMSNLAVDDRRAWERELLELYAGEYAEVSGRTIDPAYCWDSYRAQTLHGLCYWLYTIGAGVMQPAMQPHEVSIANLARMGQAVADLESIAAVEARG